MKVLSCFINQQPNIANKFLNDMKILGAYNLCFILQSWNHWNLCGNKLEDCVPLKTNLDFLVFLGNSVGLGFKKDKNAYKSKSLILLLGDHTNAEEQKCLCLREVEEK